MYCDDICKLRNVDQKCLVSYEMWYWGRMEKINGTDCVKNEVVLQGVQEERNVLQTTKRRKGNWNGHILRRSYLLKHIIE